MNTINIEEIRKKVIEHIKKRGTNVYNFAVMNEIRQPTLHRFLKGENVPNIETINKILKGLKNEGDSV